MSKKSLFVVLLIGLLALIVAPTAAQDKVTVNLFVGLGTGTQPEQQKIEDAVAAKFNSSQDKIELKIQYVDNKVANDALATLIAANNGPDIVGPVGVQGSNIFAGDWLDLTDLVAKNKYDVSQFPDAILKIYQEGDKLYGLPFAVYPGLMFYNKDLFDYSELAYPPANVGDKYKLDGKDVDWSYDTVAEVSKRLTLDKNGNDATSADFDAANIVQYGFIHQWDSMRADFETFGGAPVVGDDGKVKLADAWRAEAHWYWDGMWKDHFIPTAAVVNSDMMQPSAFASGKVAMARTMLWYTCCAASLKANWDIGAQPSYNGTTYAPADADTFRIWNGTKNPDAAFTVLQYLLGDAATDLLTAYGGFPARPDLQDSAIKAKSELLPTVKNWSIVVPSLAFAAVPHHEAPYPNYQKGQNRFQDFLTLLGSDDGKTMDVDKEFDRLQSDLQALVDAAPKS
jgi:multiple sugar transport system substrate-binding protein